MIEPERVSVLKDVEPDQDRKYVLYWMQQSQRAAGNPALEYAVRAANELELPVIVGFGLTDRYPDANERHFAFMLEGLSETATALAKRRIKTVARFGSPANVAAELAREAALVVCDRGYLRHQRQWREQLVENCSVRVVQVEGDVVVPVEHASDKREWAARTLRPKVNAHRETFVRALSATPVRKSSLRLQVHGDCDLRDGTKLLARMDVDRSVRRVDRFRGGRIEARKRLTAFLRTGLVGYADARNDPSQPQASELSPYLHFGQISPVEIAMKVQRSRGSSARDKEAYLEELVTRRELAINFVYFTPDYDTYECLPDWARTTLKQHKPDKRKTIYTRSELEAAETHDPYWNAATKEMLATGYMHNHMRMYWGKKILEWSKTPEYAYDTVLHLNNRYFLDGRDPSSYSNVAWIFGLHDQAWKERPIFGKVRYMNAGGLERKFDIDAYVSWAASLDLS
jgi:deoxyribodipyrimidine photo-lyase